MTAGPLSAGTLPSDVLYTDVVQAVTAAKTFNAGTLLDKGSLVHNVMAYGAKGDGVTDDTAALRACAAAIADDGAVRTVAFPPGNYLISSPIDWPNVVLEGNGIDTVITATRSISYMCAIAPPPGTVWTYHHIGVRGLHFEGSGLVIDFLVSIRGTFDYMAERCWFNTSAGDGLRIIAGKGPVRWCYFENCAYTGLALDWSQKLGGIPPGGYSFVGPCVVTENYWQSCGQDLAATTRWTEIYGNRFGDGRGRYPNMFFNRSLAVTIHDNVWHNAIEEGGDNQVPLIQIHDGDKGTTGKDPGRSYRIHDNILSGFVNRPTYFISVDDPPAGYRPVPKYVYRNSGTPMGTAFVNKPANFELIEDNDFDEQRGFGMSTAPVPGSATPYTNTTGHRLLVYVLEASNATYVITDIRGSVGPATPATGGGTFALLPGETVTPTYSSLSWVFYAR